MRQELRRIREHVSVMRTLHIVNRDWRQHSDSTPNPYGFGGKTHRSLESRGDGSGEPSTEQPQKRDGRARSGLQATACELSCEEDTSHKANDVQEHRDLINLRMCVLSEREGYRLLGPVERVTTKDTPKVIEKEQRQKR